MAESGRSAADFVAKLRAGAGDELEAVLDRAEGIVAEARTVAQDDGALLAERVAAVGLLGRGMKGQGEDAKLLAGMLSSRVAPELQLASVEM